MIPVSANRHPGSPPAPKSAVRTPSNDASDTKRRGAAVGRLALPRTPTPPLDAPPWLGAKEVSPARITPLLARTMERLASQPASQQAIERSEHRDIFAALDANNVLRLWPTPKKPPAIPIKERYAFTTAIASNGVEALGLLLEHPDVLLQRFRARCASLTDSAWQQAGTVHPALQQMYACLWHLSAHPEISLTFGFKDASSRYFSQQMLRPLLAVVALGGLAEVPKAAIILAAGRTASKRLKYVSGLELTLQDPNNFLQASPLHAVARRQAAGTSAPMSVDLAMTDAMSAEVPAAPRPAPAQAPKDVASASLQMIQPPSRARTPVAAMPSAPAAPAAAPVAYTVRVNGQELVLTAELMCSLAYGTDSEAAAPNNP